MAGYLSAERKTITEMGHLGAGLQAQTDLSLNSWPGTWHRCGLASGHLTFPSCHLTCHICLALRHSLCCEIADKMQGVCYAVSTRGPLHVNNEHYRIHTKGRITYSWGSEGRGGSAHRRGREGAGGHSSPTAEGRQTEGPGRSGTGLARDRELAVGREGAPRRPLGAAH